jgi:hypothetical protein
MVPIMAVPDRIPIMHEPGDQTGSIGAYRHGLFLGARVLAQPEVPAESAAPRPDGPHWYAVLHLFEPNGRHVSSQVWDAGPHAAGETTVADRAADRLAQLLHELPDAQHQDIAVQPFQLTRDGILFGLILESDPEFGEWADLLPNGLRFHAPWDGEYDT